MSHNFLQGVLQLLGSSQRTERGQHIPAGSKISRRKGDYPVMIGIYYILKTLSVKIKNKLKSFQKRWKDQFLDDIRWSRLYKPDVHVSAAQTVQTRMEQQFRIMN
jgi:hypothetical protein